VLSTKLIVFIIFASGLNLKEQFIVINFVEKIIIDASFEMSQEKAQVVRPFFLDLIRSAFPKAIDEVLNLKNKHQYKKYDQIQLDLGVISLENFQSKIIDALKNKLREAFSGQEDIILEPHEILLEILIHFFREGSVPSSAEMLWRNYQYIFKEEIKFLEAKPFSIQVVLEEFAKVYPEQLQTFLKQNISDTTFIQRFIFNASEEILLELLSFSARQAVRFFRTFYKAQSNLQLSERAIKGIIWQSIFKEIYQVHTTKSSLGRIIRALIKGLESEQKNGLRKILLRKEISISLPLEQELWTALAEEFENRVLGHYYTKKYNTPQAFLQDFVNLLTPQELQFLEDLLHHLIPPFELKSFQKGVLKYLLANFEKEIAKSPASEQSFIQTLVKFLLVESDTELIFRNIHFLKHSQNTEVADISDKLYQQLLNEAKKLKIDIALEKGELSTHQQQAVQTFKELMGLEPWSIASEKIALEMLMRLLSVGVISVSELILIEKGEISLEKAIKELLEKKKTLLREKLLTITSLPSALALSQLKLYLPENLIEILLEGLGKSLAKIPKSRLKELQNKYITPQYLLEEISFLLQNKAAKPHILEALLFASQKHPKVLTEYIQTLPDEEFKILLSHKIDFIQHLLQEDIRFVEYSPDLQAFYLTYFIEHQKLPADLAEKVSKPEAFIQQITSLLAEKHPEKLEILLAGFAAKQLKTLKKIAPELIKKIYKKLSDEELVQKALELRIKESGSEQIDTSTPETKEIAKQIREIYIENPGLVLIHPFINTLFRRLGYLADKKTFVDKEIQHRAVYLLQYIADGNTEPKEEHQLILNKLLCGISLREPLLTDIVLTDTEKETCESLLEGVIANWKALKNIKPIHFRASFMKREAKLTDKFDFWDMKVEATGVDVLLETLPWSIKLVVFPWMERSIQVDWS